MSYYWNARKPKAPKQVEEPAEESVYFMATPPELGGSNGVEIEDNKVYFYCPVGEKEVLELNRTIKKLDQTMQIIGIQFNITPPPIELHIHSDGGSAFAGMAAYDAISSCKTPVHTFIDGSAASAATLLFLAGKKKYMQKNSFMLIHQLSATTHGKFEEMKDELKNQQKIMDTVTKIYLQTSNLSEEQLTDLMKHDLWLDSETVLNYGFADEII